MSNVKADTYNDYLEDICVGPKRRVRVGVKQYEGSSPVKYIKIYLFKRDVVDSHIDYDMNSFVSLSQDEFLTLMEKMKHMENFLTRAYPNKSVKQTAKRRIIKRNMSIPATPIKKPRVVVKQEPESDEDDVVMVGESIQDSPESPPQSQGYTDYQDYTESQPY